MENSKAMMMEVHTETGVEQRRIERFERYTTMGVWGMSRPLPVLRDDEEIQWGTNNTCIILKKPVPVVFLERVEFVPGFDREVAVAYYSDGTQVDVGIQEAREMIASMLGDDE